MVLAVTQDSAEGKATDPKGGQEGLLLTTAIHFGILALPLQVCTRRLESLESCPGSKLLQTKINLVLYESLHGMPCLKPQ